MYWLCTLRLHLHISIQSLVSAFPLTVSSSDRPGFGNFTLPDNLSCYRASYTVFSVIPGSLRSFTCFGTASCSSFCFVLYRPSCLTSELWKFIRFFLWSFLYHYPVFKLSAPADLSYRLGPVLGSAVFSVCPNLSGNFSACTLVILHTELL
jgi:hypothetical protein